MSIGDNPSGRLVALVAVFPSLGELARRSESQLPASTTARTDWRQHLPSLMCLLLALNFISAEAEHQILAWGSYFARVTWGSERTTSLLGAPPALAGFLVYKDQEQGLYDLPADSLSALERSKLTAEEYMRTIIEGTKLLQSVEYRNRTVFTFDVMDPFSYTLNMQPSRNGYPQLWLTPPRTTKPRFLPRSEQVFEGVDFVMVPRLPYDTRQLKIMIVLYGPYLKQSYTQVKESPHWELWVRKSRL